MTEQLLSHALIFLSLWISSSRALDEMLEQPFRHPDCPLIDDPMHAIQLPYPNNCRRYYTCKNGFAHSMLCPKELHWSMLTYRCDFPMIAKCVYPSYNTIIHPTDQTAANSSLILEHEVYKRDDNDCNLFYKCMPIRCHPYQYWNGLIERCDSPENVKCDTSQDTRFTPSSITDNTIPTAATPPSFLQKESKPITLPVEHNSSLNDLCRTPGVEYVHHPSDCHKFIQCDGFATVHTCSNNLYWNSVIMACDRHCK